MKVPRRFSQRRLSVASECARRCPSCTVCGPSPPADVEDVLPLLVGEADAPALVLGGGDVTSWSGLERFMAAARETERAIWLEAPIGSLTRERLEELERIGVTGVRGFAEAAGKQMCEVLRVGDPRQFLGDVGETGLEVEVLLVVRPRTLPRLLALPATFPEVEFGIELLRDDWTGPRQSHDVASFRLLLENTRNVRFVARKQGASLFIPPCVLSDVFADHPEVWGDVCRPVDAPNDRLPACGSCSLRSACSWSDDPASLGSSTPVPLAERVTEESGTVDEIPAWIRNRNPEDELICTTPWTTLEMTDPGAGVNQCCSDWTSKVCATSQSSSLLEIWNGPGFQRARRAVALSPAENKLCLPVCPRLYDRQWSEWKFRIQPGGERFEQNQRIIAEDIANREVITRGMPIRMTITGSTYCNYDCIMCMCGRTPRRELPQSVWDQLPELLPYLWNLDVLGGEPLADRRVTQLLESFDTEKYPDARISLVTNGSLMTARYLSRINLNAIRGLTISLNAGTPESYRDVQRGEELGVVLENLDGLLKTRDDQAVDLNVQLSFVVQPEAIHTLEPFAKIAEERGLEIRLLPMTRIPDAAYYYTDPDKVARVVHHLDEFAKLVSNKPNWVRETRAVRDAVAATAASVQLGERSNPC